MGRGANLMRAVDIVAVIDTMSVVINLICINWLGEHFVYSYSDLCYKFLGL